MPDNISVTHDLKPLLREDLEEAEKQNPGQKFTMRVEITPDLELQVTLVAEGQQEPV